jgi:hypothetical protein
VKFIWRWVEQDRQEWDRLRRGELDDDLCGPNPDRLIARWFLLGLAPFVPIMLTDELGWERGWLWNFYFVLACIWFFVTVGLMMFSQWNAQEPRD